MAKKHIEFTFEDGPQTRDGHSTVRVINLEDQNPELLPISGVTRPTTKRKAGYLDRFDQQNFQKSI